MLKIEINEPAFDLRGFLVIDSVLNRFAVGGLRITPNVSMAEIENLARIMTLKFALLKIPFGGAKCGIISNPAWTREDRHKVLAALGRVLRPFIEAGFLTGEDMGSTSEDSFILHKAIGIDQNLFAIQAAMERGFKVELPTQMKSSETEERETNLTGMGVLRSASAALEFSGKKIKGSTFSIQGFGNVGVGAAVELASRGAVIKAIADAEGTVFCEEGLDLSDLLAARNGSGIILRDHFKKNVELLPRESWLSAKVDVLIPAAISNAITVDNQEAIQAGMVIEGANGPITPEAERRLWDRGIWVVPDFVANAGSAGSFTIFLSGQAPLHPPTIMKVIGDRIDQATRLILEKAEKYHRLPREIAEEEAQAFLNSQHGDRNFF